MTCCFVRRSGSGTLGDRVSSTPLPDHGLPVPVAGPSRCCGTRSRSCAARLASRGPRGRSERFWPRGPGYCRAICSCTGWSRRPRCRPGTGDWWPRSAPEWFHRSDLGRGAHHRPRHDHGSCVCGCSTCSPLASLRGWCCWCAPLRPRTRHEPPDTEIPAMAQRQHPPPRHPRRPTPRTRPHPQRTPATPGPTTTSLTTRRT